MSVNVYDPINDTLIPVAGATLYGDAPVGSIIAFAGKEINLPEGYLAFNGQTVKRGDYPDLWAFAVANEQVGVDKFFSQGDGSTTFTLADLRETSLKGYGETSRTVGAHVKSGGLAVGEFLDDRIQNITGSVGIRSCNSPTGDTTSTATGAFTLSDETANTDRLTTQNGSYKINKINLNASAVARSGSTTEVKAVGVVWAVKAKQVGLPIDLKEQVEEYIAPKDITSTLTINSTYCNTLTAIRSGNVVDVCFTTKNNISESNVSLATKLPKPAVGTFCYGTEVYGNGTITFTRVEADGNLIAQVTNGQTGVGHITYICE